LPPRLSSRPCTAKSHPNEPLLLPQDPSGLACARLSPYMHGICLVMTPAYFLWVAAPLMVGSAQCRSQRPRASVSRQVHCHEYVLGAVHGCRIASWGGRKPATPLHRPLGLGARGTARPPSCRPQPLYARAGASKGGAGTLGAPESNGSPWHRSEIVRIQGCANPRLRLSKTAQQLSHDEPARRLRSYHTANAPRFGRGAAAAAGHTPACV
jgi:hypothetical protein